MSQDIDNPTSPSSSYSTMDTGSLSLPEDDVSKKKRKSRTTNSPWFPKRKKKKVKKKPVEVEEDNQYEVEMIVDYKIEKGVGHYLVKWKGWSDEYDSWVPKKDLFCPDLVADYMERKQSLKEKEKDEHTGLEPDTESIPEVIVPQKRNEYESTELQEYIEGLFKPSQEDIEQAIQLVCNSQKSNVLARTKGNRMKTPMTSDDLNKFAFLVYKKKQKLLLLERNVMMQVLMRDFEKRRTEQQLRLKEWEEEISLIANGNPPIAIENNVDLEEPPVGFTYVTQCKAAEGVTIPTDPIIGCECTDCIDCRKTCCGPMSGSQSAYTKLGRLKVPVGTPIYECNDRCLCGSECANRVVQRGSKIRLCIFRTNNGRGWGLKALEAIRKNSFVIEYIGEVITNEEAERRGIKYDSEGRTYLFDLDFNDMDSTYTVDAACMGNASHFINHSCDPNLAVFAVWANCLDPNMPRLALFTQRDIQSGEELTFDYASSSSSSKTEPLSNETSSSVKGEKTVINECRCGSEKCRKIMFSLPENQMSFHTTD